MPACARHSITWRGIWRDHTIRVTEASTLRRLEQRACSLAGVATNQRRRKAAGGPRGACNWFVHAHG